MKRLLAIVGVVAFAAALAVPVSAGPSNDSLSFGLDYGAAGHHTAQPVDYLTWCGDCVSTDYTTADPWVVNPRTSWPYDLVPALYEPGCIWDTDDFYRYVSSGTVFPAGAALALHECRYSVGPTDFDYIRLVSSSPNLLVTETFQWDGGSASATVVPVADGTGWLYLGCFVAPTLFPSSSFVDVPASHGGTGVPQLITFTIANPGRKAMKTGGVIDADRRGILGRSGCQDWTHL